MCNARLSMLHELAKNVFMLTARKNQNIIKEILFASKCFWGNKENLWICVLFHKFTISAFFNFFQSEASRLAYFIIGVTTFKEENFSIAFKGEDMCAYSI